MARKQKAPPFVMLRRDLLKDPDWRELSSSSKIVYIYLRAKFNYKTFSEVSLAYSEIKDMFSTRTISKAFQSLQNTGFIVKTKHGGLFGGTCSYKFNGKFKDFYYKGFEI